MNADWMNAEVKPGGCHMVTSETRLGSQWTHCNKPAKYRCVIDHGGTEKVEEYCSFHYGAAKRRTRYDKIISASKIGHSDE